MIEVRIPQYNATEYFPDDMPREDIEKELQRKYPLKQPKEPSQQPEPISNPPVNPSGITETTPFVGGIPITSAAPSVLGFVPTTATVTPPSSAPTLEDIVGGKISSDIDTIKSIASDMGHSAKDVLESTNYFLQHFAKGAVGSFLKLEAKVPGKFGEAAQQTLDKINNAAEFYRPKDIDKNVANLIGQTGEAAGWMVPYGAIRGPMEMGAKAIPKLHPLLRAALTGAGTGAVISAGEDKKGIVTNTLLFAALEPLGLVAPAGIDYVKKVWNRFRASKAWEGLSTKEKQIVLYNLQKLMEEKQATLADLAKQEPEETADTIIGELKSRPLVQITPEAAAKEMVEKDIPTLADVGKGEGLPEGMVGAEEKIAAEPKVAEGKPKTVATEEIVVGKPKTGETAVPETVVPLTETTVEPTPPEIVSKEPIKKQPVRTKDEIIKALEKKEYYGTIDRLKRGKISLEQARNELELGTKASIPDITIAKPPNPADFAAELKARGVGKQESWSRWVQATRLRPGMDAKDWYKIYDSVSPSVNKSSQKQIAVSTPNLSPIDKPTQAAIDVLEQQKDNAWYARGKVNKAQAHKLLEQHNRLDQLIQDLKSGKKTWQDLNKRTKAYKAAKAATESNVPIVAPTTTPVPAEPHTETTEEFLARGGKITEFPPETPEMGRLKERLDALAEHPEKLLSDPELTKDDLILASGLAPFQGTFDKIAEAIQKYRLTPEERKAIMGAVKKWKLLSSEDMRLFERALGMPQFLARKYPEYNEAVDLALDTRRKMLRLVRLYGTTAEPYTDLPMDSRYRVLKVMVAEDARGEVYPEEALAQSLTPEEMAGYKAMRKTLDSAYYAYRQALISIFGEDSKVVKLADESYRTGYIPHVRKGKYWLNILDDNGKLIYNRGYKTKKQLAQAKILAEQTVPGDYTVTVGKSSGRYTDDTYALFHTESTKNLMHKLLAKHGTNIPKEELKTLETAMMQDLNNMAKARTFKAHMIYRKGIPGYVTNPDELEGIIHDYLVGNASYVSKVKAADGYMKILDKVKGKPNLHKSLETYAHEQLRSTDKLDQFTGWIQAGLFYKFLGFSPRYLLLNPTQLFIVGAPRLVEEGFNEAQAIAAITKAMKPATDPELIAAVNRATMDGDLESIMTKELSAGSAKLGSRPWQDAAQAQAIFMEASEKFNRHTMFKAAYTLLRKKGIDPETAYKRALKVNYDANWIYGKANRPEILSRAVGAQGYVTTATRMFSTFQLWSANYLNYLYSIADSKRGWRAILDSMLMLTGLTGVTSTIPYALYKWYKRISRGKPSEFDQLMVQMNRGKPAERELSRMARLGLIGLMGIDLSGSTSTNLSLTGTVGSLVDALKRAHEYAIRGDWSRWVALLSPRALDNLVMAQHYATTGYTSQSGTPIRTLKKENGKYAIPQIKLATTAQKVEQALGFRPAGVSDEFFVRSVAKGVEQYYRHKQNILTSRMERAIQNNDGTNLQELKRKYIELANEAAKFGIRIGVPQLNRINKGNLRIQAKLMGYWGEKK